MIRLHKIQPLLSNNRLLKGEGAIKPSKIIKNMIKFQAVYVGGRMKVKDFSKI